MLPIYDITQFTMIDYPGYLSSIIWFSGCNYNCKYCYNSELLKNVKKRKDEQEILSFLNKRKHLLEGVVFSGGECTLYNGIYDLIKKIKDLGFLVKIDTNGSNPTLLNKLITEKLIDYVALDFKATYDKFYEITNNIDHQSFLNTVFMLLQSNIDYEFRTTLYPQVIDTQEVKNIIQFLNNFDYKKTYYIQNYKGEKEDYSCFNVKSDIEDYIQNKNISFKIEFRNF